MKYDLLLYSESCVKFWQVKYIAPKLHAGQSDAYIFLTLKIK